MSYAEFEAIQIGIASPEQIREWSYGEVKKPETINYRTLKPERDGLFLRAHLWPHQGLGVPLRQVQEDPLQGQDLRPLRRGGHPCQGAPGAHGPHRAGRPRVPHLVFQGIPSRMGLLLDISPRILEKVLYFASYIVTDPGFSPLAKNQILSEKEYRDIAGEVRGRLRGRHGRRGGEEAAPRTSIWRSCPPPCAPELKDASGQKKARIVKRLEVVDAFRLSGNKPEWMIIDVLPVIPPEQ